MWKNVWYDIGEQDQATATAQVDDKQNVTGITKQYIQTYYALDDASGALVAVDDAYAAVDPVTSLAVPAIGTAATLNGHAGYIVTRVQPSRSKKNKNLINVQIEYNAKFSIKPPDKDKWNIDIKLGSGKTTQQAYQDKDGKDITNTAKQPYDPSVQETIYDETISVSYQTTTPPDLTGLRGMVNSDAVSFTIKGLAKSYTARQLLFDEGDISTTYTLADTTNIWKVNLTFINRDDTWIDQILDQGYYQIGSDGKLDEMKDFKTQQPLSAPARLDAFGHQLDPAAAPHYTTFKIQGEAALSGLFAGLS